MSNYSIQTQVSNDTALRDGLAKNHKLTEKVVVAGKEVNVSDVIKALDARIEAAQSAERLHREYLQATAEYRDKVQTSSELISGVRAQLIVRLGKTAPELSDYGIAQRKVRAALTLEERVNAVAKSKATRTARHTMGPKLRAKVHGELPQVVVTDTAPPAPPAAPPTAPPNGASNGAVNGASNGSVQH